MIPSKPLFAFALSLFSRITPTHALCRSPPPSQDANNIATSADGLIWIILPDNANTTLHYKQVNIRPLPSIPGGGFLAIDETSRILITSFRNGTLYGNTQNDNALIPDLKAYLNLVANGTASRNKIEKYEIIFSNTTQGEWVELHTTDVDMGTNINTWWIDHRDFAAAKVIGLTVCFMGGSGSKKWYQLFFMVSWTGESWDVAGCDDVAVQKTLIPGFGKRDGEGC
ncbi:uncharacterized protein F4822DRAFT_443872 [Hypoxylon trugodes]|uniref:uncharacterized protein n=1 Tax=Hypoxylon trugodes TaxID=326681 RepID=UPI002190AF3C|nr:uncharacterized protein F4822DRAFT_443872 [Hypoxylon trugodes]KAI1389163.1 hypothetical protein F4822DRAFT_443872 [Hypoxylon trugodes]